MQSKPEAAVLAPIPLSEPSLGGREWQYVKECLDTGWVSSAGGFVDRFERELAAATGRAHAIAVSSGTAGLHLALLTSHVGPGDEVIMPALTFVAPANAVRYVGAWPVFVDVDRVHGQIDPTAVERFLRDQCVVSAGVCRNRKTGRRVAALLPVDLLGHPCDLDALLALAREFSLAVVEDATQALGASYRGTPVGGRGRMSVVSFNGNKIMTTGGGGAVLVDDERIAQRIRYLSTQAKDDPVEFVHAEIGFNYRMTNVQAAIGCAQLEQLESFVAAKRRIAAQYRRGLAGVRGVSDMAEAEWARSTFWLYTIAVNQDETAVGSRPLLAALQSAQIQARPLWQPLHLSPAHADAVRTPCPVAEILQRDWLSLPCSTGLTDRDQCRVLDTIRFALASSRAASI